MKKPFQTRIERQDALARRAALIVGSVFVVGIVAWCVAELTLPRGHVDSVAVVKEVDLGTHIDQIIVRYGDPDRMQDEYGFCGNMPPDTKVTYYDDRHRNVKVELTFGAYSDELFLVEVKDRDTVTHRYASQGLIDQIVRLEAQAAAGRTN